MKNIEFECYCFNKTSFGECLNIFQEKSLQVCSKCNEYLFNNVYRNYEEDFKVCTDILVPTLLDLSYKYRNKKIVSGIIIKNIYHNKFRYMNKYIERINRYNDLSCKKQYYKNITKRREDILINRFGWSKYLLKKIGIKHFDKFLYKENDK